METRKGRSLHGVVNLLFAEAQVDGFAIGLVDFGCWRLGLSLLLNNGRHGAVLCIFLRT